MHACVMYKCLNHNHFGSSIGHKFVPPYPPVMVTVIVVQGAQQCCTVWQAGLRIVTLGNMFSHRGHSSPGTSSSFPPCLLSGARGTHGYRLVRRISLTSDHGCSPLRQTFDVRGGGLSAPFPGDCANEPRSLSPHLNSILQDLRGIIFIRIEHMSLENWFVCNYYVPYGQVNGYSGRVLELCTNSISINHVLKCYTWC